MIESALLSEPERLLTPNYDCFSVKFSPFDGRRIVCASASNFGMKGPGRIWTFDSFGGGGSYKAISTIDVPEAVYDVAWSEVSPSIVAVAVADGTVALYDTKFTNPPPLTSWREHEMEVNCVDWNPVKKSILLSSSFDGAIKIWNGAGPATGSISTLRGHTGHVYQAAWSPKEASVILSVASDRTIRLWDDRNPTACVKTIENGHDNEILSVDWNKWDNFVFATGSVDCSVRIWDWRMLSNSVKTMPRQVLTGSQRAVRRVKWSPFNATTLYSVGYDMTMRVWDLNSLNPLMGSWEGHTEFVTGLDISLFDKNVLIATCAWDQSIHLVRPPHCGMHLIQ